MVQQPIILPALVRRLRRGWRSESWAPMPKPRHRIAHLVGHLPARGGEQLQGLEALQREVGDIVRLELPIGTVHVVCDLGAVHQILVDEHRLYGKQTRGYDVLREFLGNGLVTSEGAFWKRQRRIAQPAFHRERIDGFVATMTESIQGLATRWQQQLARSQSGAVVLDAAEAMNHLALQIAGKTLLSTDPTAEAKEISDALDVVLRSAIGAIENPLRPPRWLKTPSVRRFDAAAATLDRIVYDLIAKRRAGTSHNDLMQMFLEARDEETGEGMTDIQLRDEVMTMFLAGHETTANAMAWTLHLLGQHPEWQERLAAEARSVDLARITSKDVAALPLTRQVVQESMRLYPPVWVVGRSPTADTKLGAYDIPAGSIVFIPIWVLHRNPTHWVDPTRFDPTRFAPEKLKAMHKMQYLPFIAGPRMCIGAQFAMMEATLATAHLARQFTWTSLGQPTPDPLVTLRPRGGVQLRLQTRAAS